MRKFFFFANTNYVSQKLFDLISFLCIHSCIFIQRFGSTSHSIHSFLIVGIIRIENFPKLVYMMETEAEKHGEAKWEILAKANNTFFTIIYANECILVFYLFSLVVSREELELELKEGGRQRMRRLNEILAGKSPE